MSIAPPIPVGKKPPMQNKRSGLLSEEENQMLFKLIGSRVQVQAAAVVQVYATEPPRHSTWHKQHCGVAIFSKDNVRRSYFIQVFDVANGEKLFEQEMYQNFLYHTSLPFFHQFEGDNSMIGLSFADEKEAKAFETAYQERQAAKQRRRDDKKRQLNQQNELFQQQKTVLQPQRNLQQQHQKQQQQLAVSHHNNNSHRNTKNRNRQIRKEEIGQPMGFRHISHVGFDLDRGFAQFTEDEQLQTFFKLAGVDQQNLDPKTRDFIYDFIDKNGGIEAARRETRHYSAFMSDGNINNNNNNSSSTVGATGPGDKPPPPPPPSSSSSVLKMQQQPPSLPARNAPPPPPRTPTTHQQMANAASSHFQPHSHHGVPPPPPPSAATAAALAPPLPPFKSSSAGSRALPPPPGGGHKSAAPPPPPPSSNGRTSAAPPPPPMPTPAPPAPPAPVQQQQPPLLPDSRSMLLDQIRGGTTLKKVEVVERCVATDSRSQLLDEIRQGTRLKPVDTDGGGDGSVSPAPPVAGLAGALAAALQNRAKHIQDVSSDEDDDEDEEEEDEWDEDG